MSENASTLEGRSAIDPKKLDRLMQLSGEMVVIRSQYVRAERLLHQDLVRQKALEKELVQAKALLESAKKAQQDPNKQLDDLSTLLGRLEEFVSLEETMGHVQSVSHTTRALEKASSELQTAIVQVAVGASGGNVDESTLMSIVPSLLLVVGGDICAFPLSSVTEIINIPKDDIYSVDGNATIKLREHALSLIELSKVIEFEENAQNEGSETKRIVVISDGEDRLGVIVDKLLGKDEIVLKPLTKHFSGVEGIVGASILADDKVALILDPAAIIQKAK